jgi:uncharacterized protein
MSRSSTTLARASRSPYVIGTALGLLNTAAFATAKRGLGITTAFESAAAIGARRLAPDAMNVNAYMAKSDETPKIDWESYLVVGVAAGSYLAARVAAERATIAVPSSWARRFGHSRAKRYAAAFLGGAVMMVGARMAKECTSGHALTGTAQVR